MAGIVEVGQKSYLAKNGDQFFTASTKSAIILGGSGGSGLRNLLSPFEIAYDLTRPTL